MMKEIKLIVKLQTKDMYHFLLHHTYTSFSGLFGVLLSIGSILMLIFNFDNYDDTAKVLLVFVASMFLVINPCILFIKAKNQIVSNPVYKNSIEYTFGEDGITVMQGEQQAFLEWNLVLRIVETKKDVFIYTTKINAFIFPVEIMGENKQTIFQIMSSNIKNPAVKLPNSIKRNK